MGLLKPATIQQAAAKVGLFGLQGSGKTTTSAFLALGLSKTYHKGAPVAFMDTENGSDYLVPIFEAEGVKLLNFKSRAFKDMRDGLHEAERAGCCAYLVDSYSHTWQELCDTFKAKSNRKKLEFHHMDALKGMWRGWTDQMLNSSLHVIMSGRLGYVWDREEDDDDGTKGDLIKLGTKMKSESEAGYEPSLLIEMESLQAEAARQKKTRAKSGTISHHAYVLKDRWRVLNGRTFTFKDINTYKPGGYRVVFDQFKPHFNMLAIGAVQTAVGDRTSAELFNDAGESATVHYGKRKEIALGEVQGILMHCWPGQDTTSKKIRSSLGEKLFDAFSWEGMQSKSLEALELGVERLRLLKDQLAKAAAAGNAPDSPEKIVEFLERIIALAPEDLVIEAEADRVMAEAVAAGPF